MYAINIILASLSYFTQAFYNYIYYNYILESIIDYIIAIAFLYYGVKVRTCFCLFCNQQCVSVYSSPQLQLFFICVFLLLKVTKKLEEKSKGISKNNSIIKRVTKLRRRETFTSQWISSKFSYPYVCHWVWKKKKEKRNMNSAGRIT